MKRLIIIALLSLLAVYAATAQDKKRCAATTKAGTQCTRTTVATYCKQHDPASARCGAKTKAGHPCTRTVKQKGQHCFQHQYK